MTLCRYSCLPRSSTLKETKSATMNIFRKKNLFKSFVKSRIKLNVSTINLCTIAENCMESELLKKRVYFPLLVIICVPPIIIDS